MVWSLEMNAMLTDLWSSKKTTRQIASEIAEAFHVPLTKNAIIGCAHRIGLEKRKPRQGLRKRKHPFSFGTVKLIRHRRREEPKEHIEPLNIPFMSIAPGQCRNVVGEPNDIDTLFCGHPMQFGSSYCPFHHARNTTVARGHAAPSPVADRTRETGEPLCGSEVTTEPITASEGHQDTQPVAA
jgi:hypothetical protein